MNRIIYISLISAFIAGCASGTLKKNEGNSDQPVTVTTNQQGSGPGVTIEVKKGKSFYYPLMAAWLEDADGKYIQTLYVAESVGRGVFKYGKTEGNKWITAPKRAPQTLPYWAHKRGVKASDGLYMPEPANPVPDAYTGATPVTSFTIVSKADKPLPSKFRVMFEINQNWDWNEYWTNDRYPDDENYKMSCQPAVVYEAVFDGSTGGTLAMKPVGHSHYSGRTGELFADLSTLTTALQIVESIKVTVR